MNTKLPENSLILLEGGSLRGLYTAGALDILMEHNLYFPAVAGVSAGALNAYNYVAHQPGRAASINLRYRHDRRYFGPLAAVKGGSLFGLNFLLNDIEKEVPFDEDMFKNGGQRMFAVATCVETGKAVYFEKDQPGLDFKQAVKASASLPLASVPVKIGGHSYLDGGCACPIPINWALRQGFDKIVIVATREKGFRKKQPSQRMVDLYDDFYGDKPLFLATLLTQEMRYNALLDQIDALEDEGRICVIRPDEPVGIGRFEGSTEKLTELYIRGYKEMQKKLDGMMEYLEK